MMTTLLRLQHPELRKWLTQALLVLLEQETASLARGNYARQPPPGHVDSRLSTSAKSVFSASVKSATPIGHLHIAGVPGVAAPCGHLLRSRRLKAIKATSTQSEGTFQPGWAERFNRQIPPPAEGEIFIIPKAVKLTGSQGDGQHEGNNS